MTQDTLAVRFEKSKAEIEQFFTRLYEKDSFEHAEMALMLHLLSQKYLLLAMEDSGYSADTLKQLRELELKTQLKPVANQTLAEELIHHTVGLGLNLTIFDSFIKSIYKETEDV